MTRIVPLAPNAAGLFPRWAFHLARKRLGRVPAPFAIMAKSPWVLASVGGFELAFEHARTLDPRLRELASVKVALEVGCRFCIDIGSAVAARSGVSEAELTALPFHGSSDAFGVLERDVLDYAVEMTRTPVEISDSLFESLRTALGETALVELTAAIAWENFRARFNHAVGAEEEGFSEGAVCLLPERSALEMVEG